MAMTKVKNLQLWCKKMAEGYRDVEVRDMAASWKSGLAFCAIIHRFRPDLIDYDSLSKENVFENNNLAFEVAEKELSIPAFLEAADMVAIRVPDRLSVVTYVSQYYNYFHNKPQLGGPGVNNFVTPGKRKDKKSSDSPTLKPLQRTTDKAEINKDRQISIGDRCTICHEKVYLMERQIDQAKLYHRRCFRDSELSPTSKLLKRHPFSQADSEENVQSTKFRKVDKPDKLAGPNKDFLRKRIDDESVKTVEKKKDTSPKHSAFITDTPTRKTNINHDNKHNNDTVIEQNKSVSGFSLKPSEKKTSGLVDRFNELDERNLKALSSNSSPSNKLIIQKTDDKFSRSGKISETEKNRPVPKPRHNLNELFEKKDTSVKEAHQSHPVPSQRIQKPEADIQPRQIEIKTPSKITNNIKSKKNLNFEIDKKNDSSSPPPLPQSSPPRLSTPKDLINTPNQKVQSPRYDTKISQISPPSSGRKQLRPDSAPAKPKRMVSPVDTSGPVQSTAVFHEPVKTSTAVLVVPKRYNVEKEQEEKQVLGGLLKTLANVRQRKDIKEGASNTSSNALDFKNKSSKDNDIDDSKTDLRKGPEHKGTKLDSNSDKLRIDSSFLSQNKELVSGNSTSTNKSVKTSQSTAPTKLTFTTTKDPTTINSNGDSKFSDNYVNKSSATTKDQTKTEKSRSKPTILQKNEENKSSDNLLDWQKEAEKRKEKIRVSYIDPEISKSQDQKKHIATSILNNSSALTDKNNSSERNVFDKQKKDKNFVIKNPISIDDRSEKVDVNKKKIGLAQKFVFEDIKLKPTAKTPEKPSGTAISEVRHKVAPPRPPQPKTSPFSPTKHHISTYQIQKNLRIIDENLTQLEQKGRTLEDSIRNAVGDKEDELMISWFELINDKNELVRRECDLIYINKNQELELEQEKIEQQLRQLVDKPPHLMTEADIQKQVDLVEKKVEIVYQRNKIVDSIDEDRLRYLEEDEEIQQMLQEKGFSKSGAERKALKKKTKKVSY